jgi:hypothetical protein
LEEVAGAGGTAKTGMANATRARTVKPIVIFFIKTFLVRHEIFSVSLKT